MGRAQERSTWLISSVVLALAVPAAVLFFFDPSLSAFYPACIFHRTTGLLCPGCGSLRALHQLLHGHVAAAFRFNPVLILSLPLLLWLGAGGVWRRMGAEPARARRPAWWLWLWLALGLAISIWRNVPSSPFAMFPG